MAIQTYTIKKMKTFLEDTYCIPDYQRDYEWTENEVSDFWDDLESVVSGEEERHFFGQIVVHNAKEGKKYIIDGQQRTLTSMILVRALQSCYRNLADETAATDVSLHDDSAYMVRDLSRYYLGEVDKGLEHAHLVLSGADNEYFAQSVLLGAPAQKKVRKKKSWERMRFAYWYFANELEKKMGDAAANARFAVLEKYRDALLEKFDVMYMEATELEEAFTIFEALNTRGRELETADLIKTFVFRRASNPEKAQKKWDEMLRNLDNEDTTQYIRYFWNASHPMARKKELYRKVIGTLKEDAVGIQSFVETLAAFSVCYHDMASAETFQYFTNKDVVAHLKVLKVLKAKTFYPVLLAMCRKGTFSDKAIAAVLDALESYTFRNATICGRTANATEKLLANVALRIFKGELTEASAITSEIRAKMAEDDAFKEAFLQWAGKKSAKELIRYILRKINRRLEEEKGGNHELNLDNDDVHIEHIMPEDAKKWKGISKDDHDKYLWRLGNLTLLGAGTNCGISNNPYAEKRDEYRTKSKIQLTIDVAEKYKHWGIREIEDRQSMLCKYALQIWK